MMKPIIFLTQLLTLSALAFVSVPNVVVAQDTPASPQPQAAQKICTSDPVENLLPPLPGQKRGNVLRCPILLLKALHKVKTGLGYAM